MEWVQIASTFGFPALFAVILFATYKELVRQVLEVVRSNTEALRDTCHSNARLEKQINALERVIQERESYAKRG